MALDSMTLLCAISAAAALLVCVLRMPIARTMLLLDTPDGVRKHHTVVTPLVGGLAVFPGIALACVEAVAHGAKDDAVAVIYAVTFGFFMVGYADDRSQIRPTRRLLMTLGLFAGLVLIAPGLSPSIFRFGDLSVTIGSGALALIAIVAASGALNAINMADGQDGLCIGLLLIWLGMLIYVDGSGYSDAALITACALVVSLVFNLGSLVFLGDLGAYGVGAFVIALLLAAVGQGRLDHGQIVSAMTLVVVDCVWLMVERRNQGHSPFDPDRQHLHHILSLSFGPWIGLGAYLTTAAVGAVGALAGNWWCVLAILGQASFVSIVRLCAPRVIETGIPILSPSDAN